MAETPRQQETNSLGLKAFNQTGREDTTTEVLRPKNDPKTTQRNVGLMAVVIVAFLLASYFVFQRSGLNFDTIVNDPGTGFGRAQQATEQNPEKSE